MQTIMVLWPLFSKPHMVTFDSFVRIIASLKLIEKISKAHHSKHEKE